MKVGVVVFTAPGSLRCRTGLTQGTFYNANCQGL